MPRGRRGRPGSTPAGRTPPPAPATRKSEQARNSDGQLIIRSQSAQEAFQTYAHGSHGSPYEQQQPYLHQVPSTATVTPPAVGDSPSLNMLNPDLYAMGGFPAVRSKTQINPEAVEKPCSSTDLQVSVPVAAHKRSYQSTAGRHASSSHRQLELDSATL